MKIISQITKKYPLTLVCIALICYLSLFFTPTKTPLDGVAFIDKWTHFVMYGGSCSVFWWEYLHKHQFRVSGWTFVLGWLTFVLASGLIELAQEYCTTNRSGEWLDLLANATGATLGTLIGMGMRRVRSEERGMKNVEGS